MTTPNANLLRDFARYGELVKIKDIASTNRNNTGYYKAQTEQDSIMGKILRLYGISTTAVLFDLTNKERNNDD